MAQSSTDPFTLIQIKDFIHFLLQIYSISYEMIQNEDITK